VYDDFHTQHTLITWHVAISLCNYVISMVASASGSAQHHMTGQLPVVRNTDVRWFAHTHRTLMTRQFINLYIYVTFMVACMLQQ
jgi:hypothetical protein